ncbi:hypothetical protein HIM_08895 [Hirsutella minnesotensis 3608]|uniref:Zn(2)-C6 fungal-type domain-containing protein n=1 Tax=Hirsutella minnesotensis 3608 TaxID=1043627 RepID=A0A0F7ZSP0_9HYPO|nr:hypothetical protein HIM_08895 [Hirsutella minnesotensis 3608]
MTKQQHTVQTENSPFLGNNNRAMTSHAVANAGSEASATRPTAAAAPAPQTADHVSSRPVACLHCRQRRSYCSKEKPSCSRCRDGGLTCVYEGARKILVNESYLRQLEAKAKALEAALAQSTSSGQGQQTALPEGEEEFEDGQPLLEPFTQLSLERPPTSFQGPASSDNFLRNVRKMSGLQGDDGRLDAQPNLYEPDALPTRRQVAGGLLQSRLPPIDVARRLFAAQYMYIGTIFAFTDPRESFEQLLADAYAGPPDLRDRQRCLGLAKVLLVLAFGQLYSVNRWVDFRGPPGFDYFSDALALLPETHEEGSVLCVETLALAGYFSQNMNRRDAAFQYIGRALRMAISLGLHHEMAAEAGDAASSRATPSRSRTTTLAPTCPRRCRPTTRATARPSSCATTRSCRASSATSTWPSTAGAPRTPRPGPAAASSPRSRPLSAPSRAGAASCRGPSAWSPKRLDAIRAAPGPAAADAQRECDWKEGLSQTTVRVIDMCIGAAQDTVNMMVVAAQRDMVATYGYMDGEHIFSATIVLLMVCATFPANVANRIAMNAGLSLLRTMGERGNSHMGARYELLANLHARVFSTGAAALGLDAVNVTRPVVSLAAAVSPDHSHMPNVTQGAVLAAPGSMLTNMMIDAPVPAGSTGGLLDSLTSFPAVDNPALDEPFYDEGAAAAGMDFSLWEEGFAYPTMDLDFDFAQHASVAGVPTATTSGPILQDIGVTYEASPTCSDLLLHASLNRGENATRTHLTRLLGTPFTPVEVRPVPTPRPGRQQVSGKTKTAISPTPVSVPDEPPESPSPVTASEPARDSAATTPELDPRAERLLLLKLAVIQFCQDILLYGFGTFLPSIVVGMGHSPVQAQYPSTPVFLLGGLCFLVVALVSDRMCLCGPWLFLSNIPGIVGYLLILCLTSDPVKFLGTGLCAGAVYNVLYLRH